MNQENDSAASYDDTAPKTEAGKQKLADLSDRAAAALKAQLDSGLSQASERVDQAAKMLSEVTERLKLENQEGLAAYSGQVAPSIESVGARLRNSNVDQLAAEARQLARSSPVLFLLGSVPLGFGLTRFLRASARFSEDDGH